MIGKYNSYEKIYTDDINIYTTTKFDVIKTIKNTTEFDISKEVVFERNGGALTLDRFTKSSQAIRAGKSKDIEEDIKDYYVIQEYDPENMLDFESKKNSGDIYIIFLNYAKEDKLMPNSLYYGIRKIKDNKVYNYDTKNYEKINHEKIKQALNEIN